MSTDWNTIHANAERLRQLQAGIDETARTALGSAAHDAACRAFHAAYDSLAFPGGLDAGMAGLKRGDPEVVETAIRYLEAEPRFHRSGYIAEEILHHLKHADLTADQVTRLVGAILRSVRQGGRRRFVRCVRLALALGDPRITAGAEDPSDDPDPEVRRRAQRLVQAMGTIIRARKHSRMR